MKETVKTRIAMILNILIVLSTVWAVGYYFFAGPDVLGSAGTGCFKYFTTDSNVLTALASLVMLVFQCRSLRDPDAAVPKPVLIFKLVGTVSVTITLLTVVFFLAPVAAAKGGWPSYLFFFTDNIFCLHLSTPLLAIAAYWLERDERITFRNSLWALSSTVVYSIVYLVMVVFVQAWTDWYGFTFGGKLYMAPVSMIAMYLLTFGLTQLFRIRKKK